MKKFYTFALAAAVAFAATATAPVQLKTLAPEKKAAANSVMETTASMVKVSHKAMAPSRADEEESITGNYTIQIGDYYFGEESIGEYEADAEIIDNGDGTITISSSEFYNAITASYDATTGEITFSQTKLGRATINNKTYYIAFEPSQWVMYDEENGDIEYNSYSATYDASTGVITFPADHGFAWIAYSDLRYSKFAGYMNLFDVLGMEKAAPAEPIDEEQAGQWKSIGNATFVDAWVIASFSINKEPVDPADFAFEAELQQNVENSNIYRLWRPYFSEGFLEIVGQNSSSYNGQIVFDVTDPDHVIVKTGLPAGWKNANG